MPTRNAIVVADFVRIRVVCRVEKKLADSGHTLEAVETAAIQSDVEPVWIFFHRFCFDMGPAGLAPFEIAML
jgi:hypothetical protein